MINPIKKGNAKLATCVGIFNLPEGISCPGQTAFCKQFCYAIKRYTTKSATDTVTMSRMRNYEFSQTPEFVPEMAKFLLQAKMPLFRPHESGDLYCQRYADDWAQLIARFPEIRFLIYTKSLHLDLSRLEALPNLMLYRSYDVTSKGIVPLDKRVTYVIPKGQNPATVAPGYFLCPAATFHAKKMHHYCGTLCKRCWLGTQKIAFPQH
jgi:hypothetical protein